MAFLAILLLLAVVAPTAAAPLPRLQVSANKHFIVTEDGHPFFWLGDTAWELFHRLNREDAERYLARRAEQRFTVIQAVALAEFDGLGEANAYGEVPLRNNDPTQPNDAYFAHVDWVVAKANSLGLYIGFLPTWGDKWNKKWGPGSGDLHGRERRDTMASGSEGGIGTPDSSGFSAATVRSRAMCSATSSARWPEVFDEATRAGTS